MSGRRGLAILLMVLAASAASAQGTRLTNETETVRRALAPFTSLLQGLPPPLRDRLIERARIWVELPVDEQIRLRENLLAWEALEPRSRPGLRGRFEAWEQLDMDTRSAVLRVAEWYEHLPEASRQPWRERFEALTPAQRQAYLFDPSSRAAMNLANELFPFVPAGEQAGTLAMLREFSAAEVDALRRRLARLPPARRDAYRRELLELDPAARRQRLAGSN